MCPTLPWTVLVYTCGSGVIINNYIHSQKYLYLDDKLYCHPSYTSLTIPGAKELIFLPCVSNIRKSFQMETLWQLFFFFFPAVKQGWIFLGVLRFWSHVLYESNLL